VPRDRVNDTDYNLETDLTYCFEPVSALGAEDLMELRAVVGRVITDPSAGRAELIEPVIGLAPEPSGQ
jgi:hypothetical protein